VSAVGDFTFFLTWFVTLLVFFGFILGMRYLKHKETIAMIEKGMLPERGGDGKRTLRWGIGVTAVGLALTLGLYSVGFMEPGGDFPLRFGPWMLAGLVPLFIGLALILIYYLTREEVEKSEAGGGGGEDSSHS